MAEVPEPLRTALRGRYDLQRELGRGGMAVVYVARDLRYDRPVAIKVLNESLAAAVGRPRFLREIAIAARLNHPHVVPLLDSGEAGELLYYVMPCVDGESLKERIEREKQLPVRDAIAIAREVAAALAHAHSHGIVHRDVKPGNILLSGGSAVMTDFGIARAVRRSASDDTLTDVNLAIGTPPYMSPEQWSGTRDLDARSDVYSLGCVVYEMLAGQPPFTGSTTEAIAARVAFDPVPPIRTVRPRVSAALERVILRALEKVPADRYATAAQFAEALAAVPIPTQEESKPVPNRWPFAGRRWAVAAAGGLAVAAAGWFFVRPLIGGDRGVVADTTLYAILPFKYQQGIAASNEDQSLRDALNRWTGITVVDPFQVRDAVGGPAGEDLSARQALDVARRVKASRYVRAEVSRAGDSLRIRGFVYDATRDGVRLHDAAVKVHADRATVEASLAALAETLLFRGTEPPRRRETIIGTSSFPARQQYARGHREVEQWKLDAADSAFAAAAAYDPQYAQAFLWLAQVRAWSVAPPARRRSSATWRSAAERAAAGSVRLSPSERLMAGALVALAKGDFAYACARWRELSTSDSLDFAAWYGLGSCLASDDVVVRDRRSPSGRSFRSSYHQATRAYQRAYLLLPSIHRALSAGSYQSVQVLLRTNSNVLRTGRAAPPDTGVFEAYAAWQGDTLAFVPYVDARVTSTTALAERRQRLLFHEIAEAWVAAYPASDDAMQALALSLEMLGDPAALDTMRRAAILATTARARVQITSAEVWMRVRLSTPDDLAGLTAARVLADSLLAAHPPPDAPAPILLASLAALLGRAGRAATYMRETTVRAEWTIPGPIVKSAAPLLVFAALGGPIDSLRMLERDLAAAIDRGIPTEDRTGLRAMWLGRAASLAFPHYRFATLARLDGLGDYLVDAQAAFARGDRDAVRRMADSIGRIRQAVPPERRTLDSVYPEAALLAESGDTARAIAWLDPTLNAIAAIAPQLLGDPVMAGSLVRAMALRARLGRDLDDRPTTERWERAVAVLWARADQFLRTEGLR